MVQKDKIIFSIIKGNKSRWFGLLILILIIYALFTVYNGFRAEVMHNDLCKKEQLILNYIAVGNQTKAFELIQELEHPSDAPAPLISRDSIISWKKYWEHRRNIHLQSISEERNQSENTP